MGQSTPLNDGNDPCFKPTLTKLPNPDCDSNLDNAVFNVLEEPPKQHGLDWCRMRLGTYVHSLKDLKEYMDGMA